MRHSLLVLAAASSLAGCGHVAPTSDVARSLDAVNVPVVSRQDYAFDAAAPDGSLAPSDAARLDGWFQGLELGYGDNIYVQGPYAGAARGDVARLAGRYGLMVSDGGPVLPGDVAPGNVRVVVSRTRASVPNCPNWSQPSQPNYNNRSMSNYGCGVNANLAAMVANPVDLVYGREGSGVADTETASRAVQSYRSTRPTGEKGLLDISTKKGN